MLAVQLQQALLLPKPQRAELALRLLGSLEDEAERVEIEEDREKLLEHLRAKLAARRL
jgi:hypothetical protein